MRSAIAPPPFKYFRFRRLTTPSRSSISANSPGSTSSFAAASATLRDSSCMRTVRSSASDAHAAASERCFETAANFGRSPTRMSAAPRSPPSASVISFAASTISSA